MQFRAKQIPPPKDWGTFEDLCHALFKQVWNDPLAQKNGRRGQIQHGVDIFGSSNSDHRAFWGIQCKGKDRNYGSKAKWSEVLKELDKAENFSPKLDKWIFATTAPVDASLQKAARELSIERLSNGLFSVDVLGWEEIQALMAVKPEVIAEFYKEHIDHLPEIIEALRTLPSLEEKLPEPLNQYDSATWETVTFDHERGLGPALMGYSLGPSDALACPQLTEVSYILHQLKIAYSVRLTGEPGSGKSICSYQAAKAWVVDGFKVMRLLNPEAENIVLDAELQEQRYLYLIDDAHLLKPHILLRIESQAGPARLILSTHNAAADQNNNRGDITIDRKRAVRTIAAALKADLPKTLKAVRLADDHVGARMMDTDLEERLEQAESAADYPWHFCFILGGGWRRSKIVADSARAVGSDLILAAVSIRQLVSLDARALPEEIVKVCEHAKIDSLIIERGLHWLRQQRLIIHEADCRTPHQRFAAVVLNRILEGQDEIGRKKIAAMIEGVLLDRQFPFVGLRALIFELLHGSTTYNWTRLLSQSNVDAAVLRCWTAEGCARSSAATVLSGLSYFSEGGAGSVVGPHVTTLAQWLSTPIDGAYGFGHLLNDLAQKDSDIAKEVLATVDPIAIALAYSNADSKTACGLGHLLSSMANVKLDSFNLKIKAAIDRGKLLELANHEAFLKQAYIFADFCGSVLRWDENLALEMAEAFVPTAQKVLASDPIAGFQQLDDILSRVLRVFDVLDVYVGKLKPTRRQRMIAQRMCKGIDPKRVAEVVSTVRPKHFQSTAFFLHFLSQKSPRKYEAVLRQLDWEKLDSSIGDDWKNMPHETEILLATLYLNLPMRHLIEKLISSKSDQIVNFSPRLMLMAPEVGLAHVAKGGLLRLAQYDLLSWYWGGIALAIIAEKKSELVAQAVSPFIGTIANNLSRYNCDFTGPAEGFVRVVINHAPDTWQAILAELDPVRVEKNLAECLTGDKDHRCVAAFVIESALDLNTPLGGTARRLRERFPKASIAPTNEISFDKHRVRSRKRRKP